VFALHDAAGAVRGYIGLIRDVTERLETERALEQERRFAEAVLETSGALVVVLDPQRHIVRTNEACRRITGYTDEELQRLPLEDLVPEEEHAGVDGVFDELFAGSYPTTHENHWITKTGEKRVIAWTSTVVSDQTGEVERIIATGIDITERIREEQNRIRRLEAEIDQLEQYSSPGDTRTTRQIYAQHSLKQADPSRFDALRNEYGTVLLDRLEERMYKTDNRISARLEELARTLGRLEAGPKDVVEMHVEALRELTAGEHPKRAQALSDEGRLLALELMGYLVSVYRNQVPYCGGA
jgi:PAS domain S-box-containing protein